VSPSTGSGSGEDQRYVWSNSAYVYMMQGVERAVLGLLTGHGAFPLDRLDILEVGCGRGFWLKEWIKWGAAPERVTGIDIRPVSIGKAAHVLPAGVRLAVGDAAALPLRSEAFDIVLQSTVFTSILEPSVRVAAASELLRMVRPSGLIVWYDFMIDNPANPNVRGVSRSELRHLFAPHLVETRRVTLAPPLMRRLAGRWPLLCAAANAIPFLRTHCLASICKLPGGSNLPSYDRRESFPS
jgi:SAM-dependent methyltransferase